MSIAATMRHHGRHISANDGRSISQETFQGDWYCCSVHLSMTHTFIQGLDRIQKVHSGTAFIIHSYDHITVLSRQESDPWWSNCLQVIHRLKASDEVISYEASLTSIACGVLSPHCVYAVADNCQLDSVE